MRGYTRERKFVGASVGFDLCLDILNHYCLPEPQHSVGIIESIYFDDHRFSAYWDKADGSGLKRKHRIRWYPGTGLLPDLRIQAFLEVKNRIGSARDKDRMAFAARRSLLETADLHDPSIQSLLYENAAAARINVPAELVPTVSIRYHRHRFVCPHSGSRICLDTNLHTGRINGDVLQDSGQITTDAVVCEIKSPTHIEWEWTGCLFRAGFKLRSFSKYGQFMHAILNGGFSE